MKTNSLGYSKRKVNNTLLPNALYEINVLWLITTTCKSLL